MFRWLEIFLPDRLKPVDDRILADSYSISLLKEAENILDKLIEQGNKYNANRTIRRRHLEHKIMVKIKKKKIIMVIQDTPLSKSKIKKKIYLQCFRKYYKSSKGTGKWIESTIHYNENGKTFIRSIKKSPYMQAIFYKMDRLDDALIGQLINKNEKLLPHLNTKESDKENEIKLLYLETKRILTHKSDWTIDPLIENKIQRILLETDQLIPDFYLLDVEERYSVKRMLGEDIPNLLHTYLSLNIDHQLQQKENVFIALSKMELTLIKLNEKIEKARLEKMELLFKVNDKRYDNKKQ